MKRLIIFFLFLSPLLTFGGAFPTIQNNISLYWGQTFRLGDNPYHSFDISYENYYSGCISAHYKGLGLRLDNFNNDNYSISIRYFRSPLRRPNLIFLPYWGISPVVFQFDNSNGLNIKPELGFRFNTLGLTYFRQIINLSINISYGYDISIINEKKFNTSHHDFSAKVALSINLYDFRRIFRTKKQIEPTYDNPLE